MLITFHMLPAGTVVFDQLPGVQFPDTPLVIQTQMGTLSGLNALTNTRIGQEFNPQPLRIVFSAPQNVVKVTVGLDQHSVEPIQAILRAFDLSGNEVDSDGPISIGPGPTPVRTLMQVQVSTALIKYVVMEYTTPFAETVGSIEFDVVGPIDPPDNQPPAVTVIQPADHAQVTGELYLLQANIHEDRKLRSVAITVLNGNSVETITEMDFHGTGPEYGIGPLWTGILAEGRNTITVKAEDFGGNVGSASVSVNRIPIEGQLILPQGPIEIVRTGTKIPVELHETFPGSLNGRKEINIRVTEPLDIYGSGQIRDMLNQPVPRLDLLIRAAYRNTLGRRTITIRAIEDATGRVLSRADIQASITPGRPVACPMDSIPFYHSIPLEDFTERLNQAVDERLVQLANHGMVGEVEKIDRMTAAYRRGRLYVSQRYLVHKYGWDANIHFSTELVPRLTLDVPRNLIFDYVNYDADAKPSFSVIDPISAFAWDQIKTLFQDGFNDRFKEFFRRRLAERIIERMNEINPFARAFLSDVYVEQGEFALGFCVPRNHFDRIMG